MYDTIFWLPAWYPTPTNPLSGTFFNEQAALVSTERKVVILYLQVRALGKKDSIKSFGIPTYKNIEIEGSVEGIALEVKIPAFYNQNRWLKALNHAYDKLFLKAMKLYGRPGLLHAHGTLFAGLGSHYLSKRYNLPNLITEHHPVVVTDFTAITAKAFVEALNYANGVSTVSQHAKRMLMLQAQQSSPVVHGNLVDENLFSLSKEKAEIFHVGWIGYPSLNKDPFTFIKALAIFKQKSLIKFKASLVIPNVDGDFSYADIQQFIDNKDVSEECTVIKGLEKDKLPHFYNSLSVLVSTSYSETFGLVMAEAAASGIPVIATRSGGAEEVVVPEVGFLVDIQDADAIAAKLLQLAANDKIFIAEQIRSSVINRFGRKVFLAKIIEIYNKIIQSK